MTRSTPALDSAATGPDAMSTPIAAPATTHGIPGLTLTEVCGEHPDYTAILRAQDIANGIPALTRGGTRR